MTWLTAGLALVFPALTRSAGTWLMLSGLVLARLVLDYLGAFVLVLVYAETPVIHLILSGMRA